MRSNYFYKCLQAPESPSNIKYIYNPDISGNDYLGRGNFGTVFRGYMNDERSKMNNFLGQPIAIKVIDKKNYMNIKYQNRNKNPEEIENIIKENQYKVNKVI